MTYAPEHTIEGPTLERAASRKRSSAAGRRPRCRDTRWPEVAAALAALRAAKRCSVRIVDADCGAGSLLLCAVRFARSLGFTAIEARGVDTAPALVDRARAAAATVRDPAIGITFERGEPIAALCEESDFPADIVLWHGGRGANASTADRAAVRAGRAVIADHPPYRRAAA
ncbi:SAM-dependent methyltransferase [Sphingomonas sp. 10B4]|uniref:SAM-dependent methyltransferase n=1 Tax=Sphingomonas sp. 10B4 TaxID=3048575 RepID=UPI002AB5B78D|nr:SAM-dependent methyltransferase [Sphingomonas sp. 10B4]MDY7524311.1 SAM-dependent methyltransferase [Sphingomonas sp. 10B4]MEB0282223.1 SAM-dependent methyltransferase [Sphingomonas sp. 10B4]